MSRHARILGAALAALAFGACNDNTPSPAPGVQVSLLTMTVDPNPISTVQASPSGPTWGVRYRVQLKETNGLGGKIELITGSLYDEANGSLIARSQNDDRDLLVFVGENRVEANGSLDIPQDLSYVAADKRAASVLVAVRFRDDRGNLLEPSLLVKAN
ncbi:MAG TPA: hypothetical protein VFM88_18685 [Vicinamibacteria bacterium]|nr:hypothetical protein [Vicinamibacteria bacterium]